MYFMIRVFDNLYLVSLHCTGHTNKKKMKNGAILCSVCVYVCL